MASAAVNFKTGDEYRRQKELEEARKAGLAPAALDEDGKEINPHIPQYMTNAPWYLNNDRPGLKHQRNWKHKNDDNKEWYDRGAKVFQATKWRKGSCENCGSMTHAVKDCLERPREKGAKWTNKNITADDKIQVIDFVSYDSKRDRWNGFDSKDYAKVTERYEQLENLRKEMKKQEQVEQIYKGQAAADGNAGEGVVGEDDEDDIKIADAEEAGFGEVKKRVRTTAGGSTGSVRNLRIREDTAKYLLNLDPNSAHYDPKSRSMREDPNPDKPDDFKTFAGDNAIRHTGDFLAWQRMTLHSREAHDMGQEVHMQANPSLAETMYAQFKTKKEALMKSTKDDVVAKYGNVAEKAPEELALLTGSERYVEYDRSGRVVKGLEVRARSRYEEDALVNNHTAVWGSWWRDGVWGYACCHQTVKNSYCTGHTGEEAAANAVAHTEANEAALAARLEEVQKQREASKLKDYKAPTSDLWGSEPSGDVALDPEKLAKAIARTERGDKEPFEADERKRGYNSLAGASEEQLSAEDMEAFRIKKARAEDPLAAHNVVGTSGYDLL